MPTWAHCAGKAGKLGSSSMGAIAPINFEKRLIATSNFDNFSLNRSTVNCNGKLGLEIILGVIMLRFFIFAYH